ncbi:MAG: AMP-dependent synthetase [Bacteroidetes bacterium]|nr:MAG: AMP-dependent synthetase [Bacteroidota bacterium]
MPSSSPQTFLDYFYQWEQTRPDAAYLHQPLGGQWISYTWREVGDQARRMVTALRAMGLQPQAKVGLISKNCAHWIIADIALKMGGWVSVPFYPNLTADQLAQVLEHSECQVLLVGKLDSLEAVKEGTPPHITCIALPLCKDPDMIRWETLIATHEPVSENRQPDPGEIETIVYTSGTTGLPKGVVKTYFGNSAGIRSTIQLTQLDKIEGRFFSYLPLNHDAERIVVEGGSIINGGMVYFAESLDTFMDNLRTARPTIFLAVPRIWVKFQMGILEKLPARKLKPLLKIPIVSGLIKKRILKGIGLDKVIWAISGAAPIAPATLKWFSRIGLAISEGYGMTENSAVCTVNPRTDIRIGTVGKPYEGCELKIDPDTKEVLMRADWVMKGYFKNPALTAEILRDGWLHTGDMGELTPEGYLKITGRVKDMFKTSKGEYILPVPMEKMFLSNTLIEQVCVVGYGMPQPFALVNLSDPARHMEAAEVEASLTHTLLEINASLADYEQVNKVVITQDVWTVENGLITPTLKVRRNVMDSRYLVRIEEWYKQEDRKVIWE